MTETLVVLAAGLSTRYGGNKQLAAVGPSGEVLLDYAVFDAVRAGFDHVAFVIRRELEDDFRTHVAARFGKRVRITYSYQELKSLPVSFELPPNRTKPWGTGHAILAAQDEVDTPFVVINADDFYGASAYTQLFEFLESPQTAQSPQFAMIGYALRETFSPHGGVSRGICECSDEGMLEQLVEVKNIEDDDGDIAGVTVDGDRYALNGDEIASMNIWGLTPAVFPILQRQFAEFLSEHREDPDAEFLISNALNEQIASGLSRLRVLPARDPWFGMTFQSDRPNVSRQIAGLVKQGFYPDDLTAWFEGAT
jgi:UTP-glucose-1-phosphate uridylyltransferase